MKSLFAQRSPGRLHQDRADIRHARLPGAETPHDFRIPFTFDPVQQPRIVVQVSINGRAPLPFWIDTGLNAGVLIDTLVAKTLGLTPLPGTPETRIGAITTRRVNVNSLAFIGQRDDDEASAECLPIPAITTALIGNIAVLRPNLNRGSIAGLIGIRALSAGVVRFDFTAHTMTLGVTESMPPTAIKGSQCPHTQFLPTTCLPLRQHPGDGRYYVSVTLQAGITTELLLDTGAEGTIIPVSVAQSLRPLGSKPVGMATAYGMSVTPMLLLPSLALGDCVLGKVAVTSLPQTPVGFPFGIDLLARFRVTLDFPQRQLLLEGPLEGASRDRLDGYTGIQLTAQGDSSVVAAIDAGSPALAAGIKAGDLIKRIDGQTLDDIPLLTARRLLNGFADRCAELTLQSAAGNRYTAEFVRRSEFSRPCLPIDGLSLLIPAHKPMEVIGVLPGSTGDQAGLRQGDIVTEFNGYPTPDITPEVLAVEFRMPQLTLQVRRAGVKDPLAFTLTAPPNKSCISTDEPIVTEQAKQCKGEKQDDHRSDC